MTAPMAFRTRNLQRVAVLVALALAFAAMPSGGGIVIVNSPTPAFTLDICHPLPGMDRTTGTLSLARPAPAAERIMLADAGAVLDARIALADAFSPPPDPPPPKLRA